MQQPRKESTALKRQPEVSPLRFQYALTLTNLTTKLSLTRIKHRNCLYTPNSTKVAWQLVIGAYAVISLRDHQTIAFQCAEPNAQSDLY